MRQIPWNARGNLQASRTQPIRDIRQDAARMVRIESQISRSLNRRLPSCRLHLLHGANRLRRPRERISSIDGSGGECGRALAVLRRGAGFCADHRSAPENVSRIRDQGSQRNADANPRDQSSAHRRQPASTEARLRA